MGQGHDDGGGCGDDNNDDDMCMCLITIHDARTANSIVLEKQ